MSHSPAHAPRRTSMVAPSCLALLLLLISALTLPSADAFNVVPPRTAARPSALLKLTPDQASDLEACAYELMKAALDAANRACEANDNVPTQQLCAPTTGPLAWCRRFLPGRTIADPEMKLQQRQSWTFNIPRCTSEMCIVCLKFNSNHQVLNR